MYHQDLLFNPLTDSNQIWCSHYSEPGDKHITRILSLYLESRATPGISASHVYFIITVTSSRRSLHVLSHRTTHFSPTGPSSCSLWDFKFSRQRVWSSEYSGMYCSVLNWKSNTAVHPRRFWASCSLLHISYCYTKVITLFMQICWRLEE
jgi:hypothetical protein